MRNTTAATAKQMPVWFDYDNQAWVRNGVYERCGHPEAMDCRCFGKLHAGEKPKPEIVAEYGR